jgi:hypothetical protein
MLLFFLSSLLFLSDSLPLDKVPLRLDNVPLKKNAVGKVGVMNSIQMIMKNVTANPNSLLKTLESLDPAAVAEVVSLVEALLASSNADLLALRKASTDANVAYDDTTSAYNSAVAEKERIDGVIATGQSDLAHQLTIVAKALSAQTLATGAKTDAQNTLDTETTRLDHEIKTLTQVLALLGNNIGPDMKDWTLFEGSFYRFDSTKRSFDDSRSFCKSIGGDLASIHSSAVNNFILGLVGASHPWIGGYDASGDNVFEWADGTAWDYTQWYPDEPNSVFERCAMFLGAADGNWNDSTCSHPFPAVCQR